VVNTWNKIFLTEPGTENSYLPALRNANKRLFLYQSMLLLNSNSNMRYYIENHTEPNSTVTEWKTAVKKSFGLNYYNDMMLEILEQYATFYWVYELQEQYMYGSSRLGSVQRNLPLVQQVLNSNSLIYYSYSNDSIRYMERGQKRFELSNHLGNVLAVVTDRKLVHCSNDELMWFEAQVVSVSDYYPFGMEIKERSWSVSAYRYGFNGKEKDSEGMGGGGATYDYGFRIYNPQLGKFLSVDPLFKSYPWYTPYQFAGNMPIAAIDLDGLEEWVTSEIFKQDQYFGLFQKCINNSDVLKEVYESVSDPNKASTHTVFALVAPEGFLGSARAGVLDGSSLNEMVNEARSDPDGLYAQFLKFNNIDPNLIAQHIFDKDYQVFAVIIDEKVTKYENGEIYTMDAFFHEIEAHLRNSVNGNSKPNDIEHYDYHKDKTLPDDDPKNEKYKSDISPPVYNPNSRAYEIFSSIKKALKPKEEISEND
jgi:RHS repeat-associated protein